MRKLLLQLDSSRLPSVFDQVVAYDAGADVIMSYGGITEGDVRDLIHGCIFTRGPKDLKNTAVWIGGNNMSAGEQLLAMAQDALFAPFSRLHHARLQRLEHHRGGRGGEDRGDARATSRARRSSSWRARARSGSARRACWPRTARSVTITSRKPEQGDKARQFIGARFDVEVEAVADEPTRPSCREVLDGAEILLNSGPAGVQMVPKRGVDRGEDAQDRRGPERRAAARHRGRRGRTMPARSGRASMVYGAFGVGNFKTKLHKACVAKLFTRNDLVLDAEAIADVAREMVSEEAVSRCRASPGSIPARSASTSAAWTTGGWCSTRPGRRPRSLADPRPLLERLLGAGPIELVVGPSGYGLPLRPARDVTRRGAAARVPGAGRRDAAASAGCGRSTRQLDAAGVPLCVHARRDPPRHGAAPPEAQPGGSGHRRQGLRRGAGDRGPGGRARRAPARCRWSCSSWAAPSPRGSRSSAARSSTASAEAAGRSAGAPPGRSTARSRSSPAR